MMILNLTIDMLVTTRGQLFRDGPKVSPFHAETLKCLKFALNQKIKFVFF